MQDTDLYARHYTEEAEIARMERMRRTREYVLFGMSWCLLFAAVLVLLFVVREVSASAFCDAASYAYNTPNTTLAEWEGYPEGWEGIPPQTFSSDPLVLYTADMAQGYHLYPLGEGGMAVVAFNSFALNAAANGANYGAHDICYVLAWRP